MHISRLLRVTIMALILLSLTPALLLAGEVGKFVQVEGRVDVLREGKSVAAPVKPGDNVSMGDVVRTKSDGKAEILFNDGTNLKLAPETRIKIDEYTFNQDNTRSKAFLNLLRGKVRAVVSKTKNLPVSTSSSSFNVQTPTAVAGVRGTDFFVFYDRGMTGVVFKEGLGFFYNRAMPEKIVNIRAGNISFVLRANTPPTPPRRATDAELSQHLKDVTFSENGTPSDVEAGAGNVETSDGQIEQVDLAEESGEQTEANSAATPSELMPVAKTSIGEGSVSPNLLPITESNPETLTDNRPPQISFISLPLPVTSVNGDIYVKSDEPATFTYSLDGGTATATSGIIDLNALSEGLHTIKITATDTSGNVSVTEYQWFYGKRHYTLNGSIVDMTSGNTIGSTSGDLSTISDQQWGSWLLNMGGTSTGGPPTAWSILAGGAGYNDDNSLAGYWLNRSSGTSSDNTLSGSSELTYLTYYTLGTGVGDLTGTYDSSNWQGTDLGLGTYVESPLAFVSGIFDDVYLPTTEEHAYFYSLFGGTESIWTANRTDPAAALWIGEYSMIKSGPFLIGLTSNNYYNNSYTTYDGGAYTGFMGGVNINDSIDAMLYGLYIDPNGNAGIIKGALAGSTYSSLGMFETEGGVYPVNMTTGIGTTPEDLLGNVVTKYFRAKGNASFTLNGIGTGSGYNYEGSYLSIGSSDWGIWNTRASGSYAGISASDTWSSSTIYDSGTTLTGTETAGSQWSNGKITGKSLGYGADSTAGSTWISAGDAIGTFDAGTQTFNILSMGAFIETNLFLDMTTTASGQAALQDLNIPFAEVGRANLTGTDGNLTVNMNDVTFFAYSNGTSPGIWATNGISGSYAVDPGLSSSVNLTGSGLNATFTVQQWSGGTWMSKIDGSGNYSGTGTMNGSSIGFSGASAGTYGSTTGTFSGTGAGVVK